MSSDNKVDTARELIYKTAFAEGFLEKIKGVRNKFNIPSKGYVMLENDKEASKVTLEGLSIWQEARTEKEKLEFYAECYELLAEFGLPLNEMPMMLDFVMTNGTWKLAEGANRPAHIVADYEKTLRTNPEKIYTDAGMPMVKVLIFDLGTKEDTLKYLNDVWSEEIQKPLEKQRGEKRRKLGEVKNKERNLRIFELSKVDVVTLRKEAGDDLGGDKVSVISRIIKAEFGEDLKETTINSLLRDIRAWNRYFGYK